MLLKSKNTECTDMIYGLDILEASIRTLDAELLNIHIENIRELTGLTLRNDI